MPHSKLFFLSTLHCSAYKRHIHIYIHIHTHINIRIHKHIHIYINILRAWWLRPSFSSARGYNLHLAEYQGISIKYSNNQHNNCHKYFLSVQRFPNTTNTTLTGVATPLLQPLYIVLAIPSRKPHTTRYISAI